MTKQIRKLRRKLRTYRKCFGFPRGVSIAVQEMMTRHPREITLFYSGVKIPIYLRLNTSDIETFMKIFQEGEYEIELSKKPIFIIDAGANIGLSSIYFANRYPDAKIIALEPEWSNYSLLRKNCEPYQSIIALNKALWSENTILDIYDPGLGKWGFQTCKREKQGINAGRNAVEGITIDQLVNDYAIPHVDLLKIDIEGAEKVVFHSALSWIEKVGVIAIELHDRHTMGCSRAFYNATNIFDQEIHKGETIYIAKQNNLKVSETSGKRDGKSS